MQNRRKRNRLSGLLQLSLRRGYCAGTKKHSPDGLGSPPIAPCSLRFRFAAKLSEAWRVQGALPCERRLRLVPLASAQPLPVARGAGGSGEPPARRQPTPVERTATLVSRLRPKDIVVPKARSRDDAEILGRPRPKLAIDASAGKHPPRSRLLRPTPTGTSSQRSSNGAAPAMHRAATTIDPVHPTRTHARVLCTR